MCNGSEHVLGAFVCKLASSKPMVVNPELQTLAGKRGVNHPQGFSDCRAGNMTRAELPSHAHRRVNVGLSLQIATEIRDSLDPRTLQLLAERSHGIQLDGRQKVVRA